MKFRYIRCLGSPNLKCIETGHIVPVDLPPHHPTTTYSERVKQAETEAIERYEKMMEDYYEN